MVDGTAYVNNPIRWCATRDTILPDPDNTDPKRRMPMYRCYKLPLKLSEENGDVLPYSHLRFSNDVQLGVR